MRNERDFGSVVSHGVGTRDAGVWVVGVVDQQLKRDESDGQNDYPDAASRKLFSSMSTAAIPHGLEHMGTEGASKR
jgi:hypothetical protein